MIYLRISSDTVKNPKHFVLDLSSYISWLKSLDVLDNQYSEENIRQLWNKAKELGEVHALTHFNGKQNPNGFGQEIFGCMPEEHFIALLVRTAIDRFHTNGIESSQLMPSDICSLM